MTLKIHRIFFSGSNKPDVYVDFSNGLNIIYGGSNAGKSFTLKAIDFMLGAETLKLPKQGEGYSHVGIWMSLPNRSKITLLRATNGGAFHLFSGEVHANELKVSIGKILASNNKNRSKVSPNDSISDYIFKNINLPSAQILKNEVGEKVTLSLRMLSHYFLVGEESMVTEQSPIKSPDNRLNTQDKSIFRYLIAGVDDSNIVAIPTSDDLKAAREGKIEILEELIQDISMRLNGENKEDLDAKFKDVLNVLNNCQSEVRIVQSDIDQLRIRRRQTYEEISNKENKLSEYFAMLSRFSELHTIYTLDIERLEAFEEGALLFKHALSRPCAVCGSDGKHQHHKEGPEDLDSKRLAAAAETSKIKLEITGLRSATLSLDNEVTQIEKELIPKKQEIEVLDNQISKLLPLEGAAREKYELAINQKEYLSNLLQIFNQHSAYERRAIILRNQKIGKQKADGLPEPIGSSSGASFAKVVLSVLKSWQFPDIETVSFDIKKQDIVVNGRDRSDNGKGIRAILHSAFKVALLIYCKENKLPHPGILILDSPLLTYRSPLQTKHGALAEDEKILKKTSLNQAFYAHLASLSEFAQIIVLENQDPPEFKGNNFTVQMWTGENGSDRQGLFPPL